VQEPIHPASPPPAPPPPAARPRTLESARSEPGRAGRVGLRGWWWV
jgi:hypothetical protein